MNRVIITGADGFVGSNTVEYFLLQGVEVLALDIVINPKRLQSHPQLKYLCLNVQNIDELLIKTPTNTFDTFIHFAWEGSAGSSRSDYELQTKNAINTVKCLKVAKQLGCQRFVCAGSIMEKEAFEAITTQGSKPSTNYVYGVGKLLAHSLCKPVAAEIGIDLIWPMITNAYGVGELSPRFVNSTIRKILNHEKLLFTSGTQNYDFVYISDVAKAFYLISRFGKPFHEYIIGSSHARPLKEFIAEMIEELDPNNPPIFGQVPFSGTNLPLSAFDCENTTNDTGFLASVSFAEGTRMTMEWLKSIN